MLEREGINPRSESNAATAAPTSLEKLCRGLDTALGSRDWGRYSELLSAEFTHRDHRVSSHVVQNRDEAVRTAQRAAEVFGHRNPCELVESRGDRMVVRRGDHGPPGDRVMAFVCVTEFEQCGLALRAETFDPSRLTSARRLLDEWYKAGLKAS